MAVKNNTNSAMTPISASQTDVVCTKISKLISSVATVKKQDNKIFFGIQGNPTYEAMQKIKHPPKMKDCFRDYV